MNILRIVIIAVSFIVVACANTKDKVPKPQEFFTTLIKRDGVKQFSYTMVMAMPDKDRRGGGAGKRGGPRGGHPSGPPPGGHGGPNGERTSDGNKAMDERFDFLFSESLTAKLEDTGFCRQGYRQLDKKIRREAIQITGECQDLASDGDSDKFPNPPSIKVKEEVIE